MEGIRTKPEVIIPPKQQDFRVIEISFFPQRKTAAVKMIVDQSTLPEEIIIDVDVSDEWSALTNTRKNNWKAMFKMIVAKASNLPTGEITGEIWD